MILSCNTPTVIGVHIRVENVSTFDYDNIVINTSVEDQDYGPILSNEISDYFEFEEAYSYAYVRITTNGNVYTLQPIDYVGESKLEDGFYRYEIGLDDLNNENISIELKEE